MGIHRVLVTCPKTNEASIRTILRNGGSFASEEFIPEQNEVIRRYWIAIDPDGQSEPHAEEDR